MFNESTQLNGKIVEQVWSPSPTAPGGKQNREPFKYQAFIPNLLSAQDFALRRTLSDALDTSERRIKTLNAPLKRGILRNLSLPLLYTETIASSRLEGIAVSYEELVDTKDDDVRDRVASVRSNLDAIEHALSIAHSDRDVVVDDLHDLHSRLMREDSLPESARSKLRTEPMWIGTSSISPRGAEYVAPPANHVPELIDDLLRFINDRNLSPLLKAAIAHVQFESIHPYADGNGRLGRALIHLVLHKEKVATNYVPPISLIMSADRTDYISGLTNFRLNRSTEWFLYFQVVVDQAIEKANELGRRARSLLVDDWPERIGKVRADSTILQILMILCAYPIVSAPWLSDLLGRSRPAVTNALTRLADAKILVPRKKEKQSYRDWYAPDVFRLIQEIEDETLELLHPTQ